MYTNGKINNFYMLEKIYVFNPHIIDYHLHILNKREELIFYINKPNKLQKINEAILVLSLNSM